MKLFDSLFKWISSTDAWVWIAKNVIGKLTFRLFGYPSFPMSKYFEIEEKIHEDPEAIYAFVSTDTKCLASILIRFMTKGTYSHAGFILPDMTLAHMMSPGLVHWHMLDLLRELDKFAVIKFKINGYEDALADVYASLSKADTFKYDFKQQLDESPGTLYCSEFVWCILRPYVNMAPSVIGGRKVFEPDDVLRFGEIVWKN